MTYTDFLTVDSMSDDAVVLDYYDCLLRNSDLILLNESHWINDNLIGFAFEYVTYRTDGIKYGTEQRDEM